jgi:ABC-type multidrug transport system ATPase subunit
MSILSGTLKPTSGSAFLAGEDLLQSTKAIHKYVGVCPQFDIVWTELSVSDHLSFQARQRGIPSERISAEVQQAAVAVGLDGDGFHTLAGQLSGGMRRRLSIAMSIVGNPPIVFMDEPTTGLDPDNRQHVWKIIQKLKSPNRLILMTTHSMEEAEALCSRIGIVAKGQLKCVGTAQHLKLKYGKGYVLTVNLMPELESSAGGSRHSDVISNEITERSEHEDELQHFVMAELGHGGDGTSLISSVNRTRKFLIQKSKTTTISEIFRLMELNKSRFRIREWGLSMSTLEDAFICVVEKAEESP